MIKFFKRIPEILKGKCEGDLQNKCTARWDRKCKSVYWERTVKQTCWVSNYFVV